MSRRPKPTVRFADDLENHVPPAYADGNAGSLSPRKDYRSSRLKKQQSQEDNGTCFSTLQDYRSSRLKKQQVYIRPGSWHGATEGSVIVTDSSDHTPSRDGSIVAGYHSTGHTLKRDCNGMQAWQDATEGSNLSYGCNSTDQGLRRDNNGIEAISPRSTRRTFCVKVSLDNFSDFASVNNGGPMEPNTVHLRSSKHDATSSISYKASDNRSKTSLKHHRHHDGQASNHRHSQFRNNEKAQTSKVRPASASLSLNMSASSSSIFLPYSDEDSQLCRSSYASPRTLTSHSSTCLFSASSSVVSAPAFGSHGSHPTSNASDCKGNTGQPGSKSSTPAFGSHHTNEALDRKASHDRPGSKSSVVASGSLSPNRKFKHDLTRVVNDLIHKVLSSQPSDIPTFCADYLEQKMHTRAIRQERQEQESVDGSMVPLSEYAKQAERVRWSPNSARQLISASLPSNLTSNLESEITPRKSSTKDTGTLIVKSSRSAKHSTKSVKSVAWHLDQPSGSSSIVTRSSSSHQDSCTPRESNYTHQEYACTTSRLGEGVTDSAAVARGVSSGLSIPETPELGGSLSGVAHSVQPQPTKKTTSTEHSASSAQNPETFIFQLPSHPHIVTLSGQQSPVTQIELIGEWVLTSSQDNTIAIWSFASGEKVAEYSCPKPPTNFVCLPNGKKKWTVLVAMNDGKVAALSVKLSKSASVKHLEEFHMHHPNPIRAMQVSPDELSLATGCCFSMPLIRHSKVKGVTHRGTLKTWNLAAILGHLQQDEPESNFECKHKALRTSRQLTSGNKNCKAGHDRPTRTSQTTDTLCFGIGAIGYSPDSSMIAVGLAAPDDSSTSTSKISGPHGKMLVLCDAASLDTLWVQQEPRYEVTSLSFFLGKGTAACPWNLLVATKQTLTTLRISTRGAKKSKGSREVKGAKEPALKVERMWKKEFKGQYSGSVDVACDGHLICTGLGSTVHVFESSTGSHVANYDAGGHHVSRIAKVKVSGDGHVILITDREGGVCAWKTPRKMAANSP